MDGVDIIIMFKGTMVAIMIVIGILTKRKKKPNDWQIFDSENQRDARAKLLANNWVPTDEGSKWNAPRLWRVWEKRNQKCLMVEIWFVPF